MAGISESWQLGNGKEEESEDPGGKGAKGESCTTKRQGKCHRGGKEAFIRRVFEANPLSTCNLSQTKFLHLQNRKKKKKTLSL